jgi:hypothetical protein
MPGWDALVWVFACPATLCRRHAGDSRVLITTDVWARGIDVQQVSLVINYDLPPNRETYIHRYAHAGPSFHSSARTVGTMRDCDTRGPTRPPCGAGRRGAHSYDICTSA